MSEGMGDDEGWVDVGEVDGGLCNLGVVVACGRPCAHMQAPHHRSLALLHDIPFVKTGFLIVLDDFGDIR